MKPQAHQRPAYRRAVARLRPMLPALLAAGWTPRELFSPSRAGPAGKSRGLAWSEWWADRRTAGVALETSGAVAFVIRETSGGEHRLRSWPMSKHPAYRRA